jgi:N-acetylmuramoyl-L-alanine amidase
MKLSNIIFGLIIIVVFTMMTITTISVAETDNDSMVIDNLGYTIVIDAGHGGIDGGTSGKGTGVKESDLNLRIAIKIKEILVSNGFNVVMTRTDKNGLYGSTDKGFKRRDMEKRREIIENADADLVISIHQNAYNSSYRKGPQVFYQKGYESGKSFALTMQTILNDKLNYKNITLNGDYYICRTSKAPAIIVECGFLSNKEDEKQLISDSYQNKLANAIAAGCIAFLFK